MKMYPLLACDGAFLVAPCSVTRVSLFSHLRCLQSQAWWHIPVIPALGGVLDPKFKVLSYTGNSRAAGL